MAMQAHRTPDILPRHNPVAFARFGAGKDLTGNASDAKKRSRDEPEFSHQYTPLPSLFNMPQQQQRTRLYGSHGTSTTKRTPAAPAAGVRVVQELEIDTLIRLQVERMQTELELVRKRQCRDIISVVGQQVVTIINEKDAELEKARWRTAELEQKVGETAAEIQLWFNVAKDNEAVICSLRSAVDEAVIQNAALASPSAKFGNRDSTQNFADDAGSCCYGGLDEEAAVRRDNEELRRRIACRMCGEKEACVLILPCRHLCICKDCEPRYDTCPVCETTKNASLQILLS